MRGLCGIRRGEDKGRVVREALRLRCSRTIWFEEEEEDGEIVNLAD